jgi:hypothetical protein
MHTGEKMLVKATVNLDDRYRFITLPEQARELMRATKWKSGDAYLLFNEKTGALERILRPEEVEMKIRNARGEIWIERDVPLELPCIEITGKDTLTCGLI